MTSALRRVPREVIGVYWESGVANDVPALAWFLLSSLVPLALGVTALAAVVLGDYAEAQALSARMAEVLPRDVHDQVVELILRTKQQSPLLIAVAIIGMVWVSSGIVGVIERCLLRLLAHPGFGVVRGKLRNLGVAAVVSIVIVLMVLVATAGTGLVRRLDINATLIRLIIPLVSLALTIVLCGAVFWVIAAGSLRWRAALAGGCLSGLVLGVTPTAAGYYLRFVAGRTPVELFLMLTGVLVTCYLAALGLLLGVGIAARVQLGRPLEGPVIVRADG
ncbi:MAG TPA: YhjD/YihY/BrkB family envelope integrity protein [Solirubrobacteraceae bacterium]|nr:YhjD/YihY/BrkB family envelope integrity protein [Solirubrobacteraceae bacterium]